MEGDKKRISLLDQYLNNVDSWLLFFLFSLVLEVFLGSEVFLHCLNGEYADWTAAAGENQEALKKHLPESHLLMCT